MDALIVYWWSSLETQKPRDSREMDCADWQIMSTDSRRRELKILVSFCSQFLYQTDFHNPVACSRLLVCLFACDSQSADQPRRCRGKLAWPACCNATSSVYCNQRSKIMHNTRLLLWIPGGCYRKLVLECSTAVRQFHFQDSTDRSRSWEAVNLQRWLCCHPRCGWYKYGKEFDLSAIHMAASNTVMSI